MQRAPHSLVITKQSTLVTLYLDWPHQITWHRRCYGKGPLSLFLHMKEVGWKNTDRFSNLEIRWHALPVFWNSSPGAQYNITSTAVCFIYFLYTLSYAG